MRSDQATQGNMQLGLENLQGQRQAVPVLDCPCHEKKIFTYASSHA